MVGKKIQKYYTWFLKGMPGRLANAIPSGRLPKIGVFMVIYTGRKKRKTPALN